MTVALSEATRATVRSGFGHRRILVVGDLMLDRYSWGDVRRISPEAPVQVLNLERQTENAGGAGNVAAGLRQLGLEVRVVGLVGNDEAGTTVCRLLRDAGCAVDGIIRDQGGRTTVKHRVVGAHQQLLRIDDEAAPVDGVAATRGLTSALDRELERRVHAVLISDYAKGAITESVSQHVIAKARDLGIPVLVDPKGEDYAKYAGATAVTPNQHELSLATRPTANGADEPEADARQLASDLGLEFVLVTQGERGMLLVEETTALHVPALARDVFDVSGAGDTVLATLSAGLAAGIPRAEAVVVANIAASIAVEKVGTQPVELAELVEALPPELGHPSRPGGSAHKILDDRALDARLHSWRASGKTIAFTNGCFDLLHAGHISSLEQARAQGDRLVVGLNSDASVTRLKGPGRPIVAVEDRARVLAALEAVDVVVVFDEDDPLRLVQRVRPDVLVKGSDYAEEDVIGGAEVRSWGGRVVLVDLLDGRSTSNLVSRYSALDDGEAFP